MKKLIIALLACLLLTGCGKSTRIKVPEDSTNAGIGGGPLMIYAKVTAAEGGIVTVTVYNESGYDMAYCTGFTLQRLTGGEWQDVSAPEGSEAENREIPIADLETAEVTCDLTAYGTLEKGSYRLLLGELDAEFEVI